MAFDAPKITMPAGIEVVPIDSLIPYARNSRTHTDGQIAELAAIIQEFGWTQPIVVKGTKVAVGHARLRAARKLGMTEVPIIRRDDLTDDQFRAYVIADNRIAEKAGWDPDMLAAEFDGLAASGFKLEHTGFTFDEVKDIQKKASKEQAHRRGQENEDSFNEIPANPITRLGDVWECGGHIVACGDSLSGDLLPSLIKVGGVQLIACDPPYAIYGSATGIASNISDDKMVRPFFEKVLQLGKQYLPWFAHCYLCCDWRSWSAIWESAKQVATIEPKNMIVWDKGDYGMGNNYFNCHELVAYFAKLPPEKTMTGSRATGQKPIFKPNIKRFSRPTGADRQHNAAKPVALFRELIEESTGPGDLVLDPFCGSGTTLIAADQLERRCVTVDITPAWVDVAVWRYITLRKGPAVLRGSNGKTFEEIAHERGLGEVIVGKLAKNSNPKPATRGKGRKKGDPPAPAPSALEQEPSPGNVPSSDEPKDKGPVH